MRSTKLPSWIERLAGLDPVPVAPHVFAVAPGRLDYACCQRVAGGELRVTAYRAAELPAGTFQPGMLGGPLADPAAFRQGLAAFIASLDAPVKAASLVLPDAWLRLTVTEADELPPPGTARDDVLRWKLKRLVPFRVEDLRVQGVELAPWAGDGERRLLLAFALEVPVAQLEEAFAAAGVALGQISNVSLSLLGGLRPPPAAGLHGLVVVEPEGAYSLVFGRGDEPVLHRYKASMRELAGAARAAMVERDLRLTRTFLEQQHGGLGPGRTVLAAPPDEEPHWREWLAAGLGGEVEPLAAGHLHTLEPLDGYPLQQLAPLLGAASREVA